jgi:hypothetical protein
MTRRRLAQPRPTVVSTVLGEAEAPSASIGPAVRLRRTSQDNAGGAPSMLPPEKSTAHAPLSLAPLRLDSLGPTTQTASPCPVSPGYRPHAARARAPPHGLVGDLPPVSQLHAAGGCGLLSRSARAALRGNGDAHDFRGATLGAPCPPGAWGVSGLRLPDAIALAHDLHARRRRRSRVSYAALVYDGARTEAAGADPVRARAVARADGRGALRPHVPRTARAGRPPPGASRLPRLRGRSLSRGPRRRTPRVRVRAAAPEPEAAGAAANWPPATDAARPTPAPRVGLCAPRPGRARATHGKPVSTRSRRASVEGAVIPVCDPERVASVSPRSHLWKPCEQRDPCAVCTAEACGPTKRAIGRIPGHVLRRNLMSLARHTAFV